MNKPQPASKRQVPEALQRCCALLVRIVRKVREHKARALVISLITAVLAGIGLLADLDQLFPRKAQFSDLESGSFKPSLFLFEHLLGTPSWTITLNPSPESVERIYAASNTFYVSHNGVYYFSATWNPISIRSAEPINSKTLYVKLKPYESEMLGPFEYEFDFRQALFERFKSKIRENQILRCYGRSCALSRLTTEALGFIDQISYSNNQDLSDAVTLTVPEITDEQIVNEAFLESIAESLLPSRIESAAGAENIYSRIRFADGVESEIKSIYLKPARNRF